MTSRPLLIPLLSMMAGLSTAYLTGRFLPSSLLFPLPGAALIFLFAKNRIPFLAAISLCFFVWGDLALKPLLAPELHAAAIARHADDEPRIIEGVIDERPEWRETGGKIAVRVTRLFLGGKAVPVVGRLLVQVGEGRGELLTGDLVRFESRIRRPRNFGVPGEFDYVRYLALREIHATAFVPEASRMVLIRSGIRYPVRHYIDSIASDLGRRISEAVPGEDGAVLRAMLLGDSGGIPDSLRDMYSRTGVNHILSISGFHLGVLAFFTFQLLFRFARRSRFLLLHANLRRSVLILTLPVLLFYLFLSGAAPATVRSALMIAAFMTALWLDRETDPQNALVLAAFLILAISPAALFDISFQLSFMAVWGIIVLTPIFMSPFARLGEGLPRKLVLSFMVSAAATAATLIPVSTHFHRATITGLIANLAVVPLMGYGAVVLGFSALPLIRPCPFLGELLLQIAGFLVNFTGRVLAVLARIPLLPPWRTGEFDLLLAFFALASLAFLSGRRRRIACIAALALVFIAWRIPWTGSETGELRIDFFSVGQGESTLITFPDGRRMLVDGGGSLRDGGLDPGERLLIPALRSMGIDRLDYLVLTHPHPDHLKGLIRTAEAFELGEFWESGAGRGERDYDALKGLLARKGVPVRRIDASTPPVAVGGVVIEPLNPKGEGGSGAGGEGDLNETSLVFRLRAGGFTALFTGDIGHETEERLLSNRSALRATVLKVPHHGSRYSTSEPILEAVDPVCALIGAGYGNRFRLPSPETLSRLRKRGTRVFRTDLDGTVTVRFRNGHWSVATYRQGGHFR